MARRIPTLEDETPEAILDAPTMVGGSPGVEDGQKQSFGGRETAPTQKVFEKVTVRRFIHDSPNSRLINIDGNIATLRAGQIVDESNFDIAALRRDGIPLRELTE